MQNFQVIVLSIWEPTDKISHFHDCTFNEKLATRALHMQSNEASYDQVLPSYECFSRNISAAFWTK